MKRRIFSYGVLWMLAGLVLLPLGSCKKEPLAEVDGQVMLVDETERKVKDFIAKVEKRKMKSGEEFEKEESLWLLEASGNYVYVNYQEEGEDIIRGECYFPVTFDNNEKIDGLALSEVWADIADTLSAIAALAAGEEIHLKFLDMSWETQESQDYLKLEYTFVRGGTGAPWSPNADWGPDAYWWYAMGWGMCNGNVCCTGKDATTEMSRRFMLNMAYPTNHKYFTDIEIVPLMNPINLPPGSPNPNFCYFNTFYSTNQPPFDTTHHLCLSPTEMNFHYHKINSLIPTLKPLEDPQNPISNPKTFAGIIFIPVQTLNNNGYEVASHTVLLLYGISHPSPSWLPHGW